jgi:hypothetical protein
MGNEERERGRDGKRERERGRVEERERKRARGKGHNIIHLQHHLPYTTP